MGRALAVAVVALAGAGALSCDAGGDVRAYDMPKPRVTLKGVGATASRTLFAKWAEEYALVDPATTLHYDPAGSGAGVQAALGGDTSDSDFGVSDAPMSDTDMAGRHDVRHLPVAVEALAIVYSLAGVSSPHLQATEDVVADAFLGKIRWWDDPAIAALNPGVKLPHTAIIPLTRADQSGSSYLLSEWLSKTSSHWTIAPTRALSLPQGVGVQKDDGMLWRTRAYDGSLGYLSVALASSEHVPTLAVRNAAGHFVLPSLEAMRAAAETASVGPDLRGYAVAVPGDLAYPICSFTFVLVRADGKNEASRRSLARFFWWATHDGQAFAPALGFGVLPGELVVRDEGAIRALRAAGQPAL